MLSRQSLVPLLWREVGVSFFTPKSCPSTSEKDCLMDSYEDDEASNHPVLFSSVAKTIKNLQLYLH